jgi:hypothetical protein
MATLLGLAGSSLWGQGYPQPQYAAPTSAASYYSPYATQHAAAPLASGQLAGHCHSGDCQHCCSSHCQTGCCLHRTGGFAEYLHWQVRGIDMAYAVPQDGIGGAGTTPMGEVGTADFDYDNGFRAGFNLALDCQSSVGATFTSFEARTSDSIEVAAPGVIQPLVMFPGTFNAGFTAQAAAAAYALDLRLIDLDYRAVWLQGCDYHVNYLAGLRYGHLDQDFEAVFPFATPDGTTQVDSDINFDGGGIRVGLEGERAVWKQAGLRVYGKTTASLLAGEFRSSYLQANQFNGIEAEITWDDRRVVPIGEWELGVSWVSRGDFVRVSAGYHFAWWGNVVTTPELINAVQGYNFTDVGQDTEDDITFDGLVARLELRM